MRHLYNSGSNVPALRVKKQTKSTNGEEGWYRAKAFLRPGVFIFFGGTTMKSLTGEEIRRLWIHFFESKGHKYIPGVSLIPEGDKSLLWVNAGVTGLKKYFDGSEIPPCRRIVNVQKSIRTNDIENVGHTARHHTFFEMLGNFSIGDYFRNEVIPWAFELLTSEEVGFGLPKEKIYVTYNPDDKASFELWQKQGIDPSHLIPLEGNYWQIGEGPCGPNTEVFFDRGEKYDPKKLGKKLLEDDIENDRFIELWGIVFSQYNAENGVARKDYKELPSKNIDTGAGLERIACILQGTETNFETDLFKPIIEEAEKMSGKKYEGENLLPFRVIADHARCLTFALNDGTYFSNEGRGYVLRRIVRRAMRYGQKLGLNEPFMYKLVPTVVHKYKDFYPELTKKEETVMSLIKSEEERFVKTLSSGEALLKEMLESKKTLSGEDAFKLYDTFGFPLDLTKEIAAEKGVKVDEETFQKRMDEQRERARSARGEIESFHKQSKDLLNFQIESSFSYDSLSMDSKIIGLFVDGTRVQTIDKEGDVILEETPFYAEMGGQVSDTGSIQGKGVLAEVSAVSISPNKQNLHHVTMKEGMLKEGDILHLAVNEERRHLIERNHSATHLLHSALSEVLGEHVDQKGSYVDENYLRFDYEASKKLSAEEKAAIEHKVNDLIAKGIEEKTLVLPFKEASKLGAEMEFSEKYGDTVRVVTFGDFSKEFCGGTHVKNTADIGLFTILSDEAISSGVRRIVAKTSLGALDLLKEKEKNLASLEELFSCKGEEVLSKVRSLLESEKTIKKENGILKEKMASLDAKNMGSLIKDVNGISLLTVLKEGANREDLLSLADRFKSGTKDYCFVLMGGREGGRPIVIMVNGKAADKVSANALIKEMSEKMLGGGGGKPQMASGMLKKSEGFEAFADSLKERLQ